MSSFLDQYDPLDIIGNGSFGIIRKVRRKSDGLVSPGWGVGQRPCGAGEANACSGLCEEGAEFREDE